MDIKGEILTLEDCAKGKNPRRWCNDCGAEFQKMPLANTTVYGCMPCWKGKKFAGPCPQNAAPHGRRAAMGILMPLPSSPLFNQDNVPNMVRRSSSASALVRRNTMPASVPALDIPSDREGSKLSRMKLKEEFASGSKDKPQTGEGRSRSKELKRRESLPALDTPPPAPEPEPAIGGRRWSLCAAPGTNLVVEEEEEEEDEEDEDEEEVHEKECIDSQERPWAGAGPPDDTVIIFDWDDTLLCTSAINAEQCSPGQLRQLERAVECVLQAAMQLGETLIVTNGNASWVEDSTSRFLPGILPTLRCLEVISARAQYECDYPGDPFAWKRKAFREILQTRRAARRPEPQGSEGLAGGSPGTNLVVLGDSLAEMEAAEDATAVMSAPSVVKTIKFKERPLVTELLGQIRKVVQELGSIVEGSCSTKKGLSKRVLPEHLAHLGAMASGWRLCGTGGTFSPAWHSRGSMETDLLRALGMPPWVVKATQQLVCGGPSDELHKPYEYADDCDDGDSDDGKDCKSLARHQDYMCTQAMLIA
mmetsp:Transcript_81960/g.182872  ORF Transcript_81960/g.182872 Transcript_81960/m.182872 type:complete len:533 (+) Transcript_81960:161-1759(+)